MKLKGNKLVTKRLFASAFLAFALVACGGGGGGGSSSSNNGGNSGGSTNTAPAITLSSSGTVNEGDTFSVTATASDSDGTISSYSWSQTSGPSVTIDNPSSSTLSFIAPSVTTDTNISFSLTVTDDDGATSTASITITIANTSSSGGNGTPSLVIEGVTAVESGELVTLFANATDSNGTIEEYLWEQTSGPGVAILNNANTINFAAPNTSSVLSMSFTVTVTDNDGNTASASVQIQVSPASQGSTAAINGKVLSFKTGKPVAGAIVTSNGQSDTTDNDGFYVLQNIPFSSRAIVNVTHSDYAPMSKVVRTSPVEKNVKLTFKALPLAVNAVFTQTNGRTINDPNTPSSVEIHIDQSSQQSDTLVDGNGNTYTGSITGKLTSIDVSQRSDVMQGDFLQSGGLTSLESYGAVSFSYEDSNGNPLTIRNGDHVTVRIALRSRRVPPTNRIEGVNYIYSSSERLYFFDEAQNVWVQEGTIDGTGGAGSNMYYEAKVSRTGTWAVMSSYSQVNVNGCVVDLNGNPLSDISIISDGDSYTGSATSTTDGNGNFSVKVKSNSRAMIWANNSGSRSNTVPFSTSSFNDSINDCLVMSPFAATMILTWGEEPVDLDGHLFGPSYQVYHGDKGSLVSYPWAQQDVDDLSEYGPEVITLVAFPEDGTYTYKVHNWSDTHSPGLTNSIARVELNYVGDVYLYIPPAGETFKRLWNVFSFDVANGQINLTPVGTWDNDL